MGLTLEFLTGDSAKIETAFLKDDFDLLDSPQVVHKRADLSLHIVPKDLDLLSYQFGKFARSAPIALRPYLHVILDEEDRGLFLVDKDWITYAATVAEDTVNKIDEGWFDAMRQEYPNENIELTPAATKAIGDLVSLCKYAIQHRLAVYHCWWL
ncbi:hypothetical protein BROC_01699 [Candidatus Brocadiaceae bacterium]|nr:hypothetical protein BROC_01699 [Candidatus Brocadiaceae bacterium]